MIIWRKKGWIVIVLAFLAIGVPLELDAEYIGLGQLFLFLIFGGMIWLIGNKLNAGQNYYSQQAGKFRWEDVFEVGAHDEHEPQDLFGAELSPSHSFTMIKIQYWAFIFVLAGVFCYIMNMV